MKIILIILTFCLVDTTPPEVRIIQPHAYDVFGTNENVTISAQATDDVGVEYVTFIIDNIIVGVDYQKPYKATFNTNIVAPGYHTIQAQAIDAAGNGAAYVSAITTQ